jgi:hypothetical protein
MTRSLLSICSLLPLVAAPAVALASPVEVRCADQRNPKTGTLTRWTGNFYVTAYCESTP